jgi:hypothetical protein
MMPSKEGGWGINMFPPQLILVTAVILNSTYYISVWTMDLFRQTYWDGKGEELNITKRNIDRE